MLDKIGKFMSGGFFKSAKDTIMAYLPPGLTPQQKLEFELKFDALAAEKDAAADKALAESTEALNKRIAEQEGTASDLKSIPIFGTIVIFLRGVQRPAWGFYTMYLDWVWFSTVTDYSEQQQTALILINILVLGFLFGERTIKNLSPLIIKVFGAPSK